jgi:four helix bundle protein
LFVYEKLFVYRKAFEVSKIVYKLVKANNGIAVYAKDQFGRAALSIMLNIAEGSAKISNKDRRNFFVIARASVFECASLLSFLTDENEIEENLKSGIYEKLEEISRILYTMINNLK